MMGMLRASSVGGPDGRCLTDFSKLAAQHAGKSEYKRESLRERGCKFREEEVKRAETVVA
jgi:hypothetical protein